MEWKGFLGKLGPLQRLQKKYSNNKLDDNILLQPSFFYNNARFMNELVGDDDKIVNLNNT